MIEHRSSECTVEHCVCGARAQWVEINGMAGWVCSHCGMPVESGTYRPNREAGIQHDGM